MNFRPTAGAVIVGPNNQIAVVNQHGNSWSLPKGGVDAGETDRQAAEREIYEETGLSNIEYVCDLGTYRRARIGKHGKGEQSSQIKILTFFLYRTGESELKPKDPDNPEAIWLDIEKVASKLTHPKDIEFFESQIPTIQKYLQKL